MGIFLVLTLLIGNVINSFMEEGLFRGALITHLGSRMNMGRANLFLQISTATGIPGTLALRIDGASCGSKVAAGK